MSIVLTLVIGILAVMGLIEAVENIRRWFLRDREPEALFLCVPLSGQDEALEYKIRCLIQQMGDVRFLRGKRLYLLDWGLSPEGREVCERLESQYAQLRVCRAEELTDFIQAGTVCKEKDPVL